MADKEAENIVGAIIFFSYILAALFVTGFIARDLSRLYTASHDVRRIKHRSVADTAKRRDCAQIFVAISLISFAALSYHMLNFLVVSYVAWCAESGSLLPTKVLGATGIFDLRGQQTPLHLWKWSTQSTLFQTFAEAIVDDQQRYWWTQQCLLYSLGWNIYMAIEGTRCRVPHLWAYYILDQILPVSFTQNLFCVALYLSPETLQVSKIKPAASGDQFVVVFFYLLGLSTAPTTSGTPIFFFVLFGIRALLLAPYWMLRPVALGISNVGHAPPEMLFWRYRFSALILAVGGIFLHVRQSQRIVSIVEAVKAINYDPAISTLGYDYLIAVLSLFVFIILRKLVS